MFDYDNHLEIGCFTCNECRAILDVEGSWQECMQQGKDEGWRTVKNVHGSWDNFCANCVKEYAKRLRKP